jgi:hypothetical protein
VFAFDASELGITEGETDHIKRTDETPIFNSNTGAHMQEKDTSGQMEERNSGRLYQNFHSAWAASVTMPPKKDENDGNWTLKRP